MVCSSIDIYNYDFMQLFLKQKKPVINKSIFVLCFLTPMQCFKPALFISLYIIELLFRAFLSQPEGLPSRANTQKRYLFHYRGLECKSRKYQEIPGVTGKFGLGVQNEGGQTKANRALPRERTGHSKHLFHQHKRRLYTWTSPDGQYSNQIDYILWT